MQAKIKKERDAFVIHLSGKVDFDSSEPFRTTLLNHVKGSNVVFNMQGLDFVGSNGITPFVQTIKDLLQGSTALVRFCHLSSEFVRIFEANEVAFGYNFQDEASAVNSLYSIPVQTMPDFQDKPGATIAPCPVEGIQRAVVSSQQIAADQAPVQQARPVGVVQADQQPVAQESYTEPAAIKVPGDLPPVSE